MAARTRAARSRTAARKTAARKTAAKPAKAATKSTKPAKVATKPVKPRRSSRLGLLAIEAQLREHALAKPEATEHFPWGERAIKVNGKVFLFMRADAQQLSLSTKLPESAQVALLLPFATPTGYGLGKAGWVSASFGPGEPPPVEMLQSWIDESYQAVAPARLARLSRG